jgi:hypothetical protein
MSKITELASGTINQSGDTLSVEVVEPAGAPPAVLIRWPAAPTITTAARVQRSRQHSHEVVG